MIHITLAHTHKYKYTHTLANYIRPVAHLLPQLCQRLSQTSSPRTHTHTRILRQEGRGGEDKQAREDGGQGTHADKPDNRQETLESSRCYFLSSSSMLSVSILDKTGRKKTTQS